MNIVNCKDCGKKYQLNTSENLRNFQCVCGGNLEFLIENPEKTLKYING